MFPGLNPKKMQAMMKQIGISQDEISAERVIIEKADSRIIVNNPTVIKINMKGESSYQISGEESEESAEEEAEGEKLEADIAAVMECAGVSRAVAATELEKCGGDIAQAIINLEEKS